jgi:hypothetical protein
MYIVNGHKMRIDCAGNGSPTIVLESGAGNDGLVWGGVQPVLAEDRCHEPFNAIAAEGDSFDLSGEETVHTGPYGALPVLILTHDFARDVAGGLPADQIQAAGQMQEDLKKLSTRSHRVIAKGSGHYIQMDRPELIETDVSLFVEQIRGTAPQPADYGSTTTE